MASAPCAPSRDREIVDASKQVIFGDVVIEAEIVEQLRGLRLHPHHRSAPPQSNTRLEITPASTDQPETKSTISASTERPLNIGLDPEQHQNERDGEWLGQPK